ncbi:hypothetical protein [Bacillus sp. MUM 116]
MEDLRDEMYQLARKKGLASQKFLKSA